MLKNRHFEQATFVSVVVKLSHDFAWSELMQSVISIAGEFVLDGAEDVLNSEVGAEALDEL